MVCAPLSILDENSRDFISIYESEDTVRNTRTIVDLLRERTMDGSDRLRRRKSLQERLGLKSMVCCGSTWGLGSSTISTGVVAADDDRNDTDVVDSVHPQMDVINVNPDSNSDPDCIFPSPRMNLAAALAAERNFRSTAMTVDGGGPLSPSDMATNDTLPRMSTVEGGTPLRISLMRLLEESELDGQDDEKEKEKDGLGRDLVCCVCMGRKKGAAFIPCGHTFCRVCSRELWLNRGTCPLCNRSIFEILDIY